MAGFGAGTAPADILLSVELVEDVLINEPVAHDETLVFDVRVDTTHPTLFDHPLDHLPGMLQLEAIRQAAQ